MCLLACLKLRRTGLGRHGIGVGAHGGTGSLCHNRPHQPRQPGRLISRHQTAISRRHKLADLLPSRSLNRIQKIRLHQGSAIGNGRRDHGIVHGRDLSGALADGGLKDLPCVGPRHHVKGAFLVGHSRNGERPIEQQALGRAAKRSQIQLQSQIGKRSVTGVGKCQRKILVPMSRAVEAFDPVHPILINTAAIELIILIALRMLPHMLQGGHNLKGGPGRIKALSGTV